MTRFEYKFELNIGEPPHDNNETDYSENQLNAWGAEGWDLVAVSPCGKDNSYLGFWFKRPIA
jgi:hypothetical protein